MKIRYKIILMILCLLIPSIIILAVAIPIGIQGRMIADAENKLLDSKKIAELILSQKLSNYTEEELKEISMDTAGELGKMLNLRVSIYSPDIMLADSSNLFEEMPVEIDAALDGETNYRKTEDNIYFAFPIKNIGAVRIIYPMEMINQVTNQSESLIVSIGLIVLLLTSIGAVVLAGRFSKPITDLNSQAERIKNGEYDLQIKPKSKDEIGGLTLSFLDMSRQIKQRIGQLEIALERERQLKDLQRNFINNVTHEFKTPLTSIMGYSDLLDQYKDDPALLYDAIRIIKSEGERLYRMVEKVLYLSKVDRFSFSLEKTEFSLQELVDKCIDGVSVKAKNQNVRVLKNIRHNGLICGDFDMLYRMIINLLDNSIKYNRNGGFVSIDASLGDTKALISVKDNGHGIAREHLERIFEPFYRGDKDRSRKTGGDGLGLAIVKEIVEKHGGTISIKSEIDKGTEISIVLPCGQDKKGGDS